MSDEVKADISNWRTSPHTHWAFHNIEKLLPTARIPKSSKPIVLTPSSRTLEITVNGQSLPEILQATATDGLVVLHNGALVYEYYGNGSTAHTPHILMSATKSITGLILGILATQGTIDPAAPVSRYVPEAPPAYRDATLHQLADMRAGVVHDDNTHAYRLAMCWEPPAAGEAQTSLHAFIAGLDVPVEPHGGGFSYVSVNTDLLGWALERASGKPFAQLVAELLWERIGAEADALLSVDGEGSARAAGGVCATTRDFARLGMGLMPGAGVVPDGFIKDIQENGDAEAWQQGRFAGVFTNIYGDMVYRSAWYVLKELRLLMATGIHGQNLLVDRENGIVIAKTSSQGNPLDLKAWALGYKAAIEIRKALLTDST